MKYFKINFSRLGWLLLPFSYRVESVFVFVDSLLTPVIFIYNKFWRARKANIYRLTITPQVCFLEKLLNDRFDIDQRRIYISEGTFYDSLYIFTSDELNDLYVFAESENTPVSLYSAGESGAESADFIVNVPASLQFDLNEFRALLDSYKLVTKTYSINKI